MALGIVAAVAVCCAVVAVKGLHTDKTVRDESVKSRHVSLVMPASWVRPYPLRVRRNSPF